MPPCRQLADSGYLPLPDLPTSDFRLFSVARRSSADPRPRHLLGGDVEAVPYVDQPDLDDQGRQRGLVVVPAGLVPDSSGTGSGRSLSRVTASVSASAARSASLKYGVSRQAATAKSRSSGSPACLSSRACMSTQTPQPLIWLARRWTSLRVTSGRSALLRRFVQREQGLQGAWNDQRRVAHPCLHVQLHDSSPPGMFRYRCSIRDVEHSGCDAIHGCRFPVTSASFRSSLP